MVFLADCFKGHPGRGEIPVAPVPDKASANLFPLGFSLPIVEKNSREDRPVLRKKVASKESETPPTDVRTKNLYNFGVSKNQLYTGLQTDSSRFSSLRHDRSLSLFICAVNATLRKETVEGHAVVTDNAPPCMFASKAEAVVLIFPPFFWNNRRKRVDFPKDGIPDASLYVFPVVQRSLRSLMRCHLIKTICFAGVALAMISFSSPLSLSAGEGGWLGITVQNVSPRDAFRLGLDSSSGVVVTMVRQGGPADRGGMKQEDVIVEFDGRPVENVSKLKELVGKSSPGSRVKIKIIRRRNETTLSVYIGREPREAA